MADVRAIVEAYPGSAPLEVQWSDGNGVAGTAAFRGR